MDLDELKQSGFALFVLFVYHGSSISASLSQQMKLLERGVKGTNKYKGY